MFRDDAVADGEAEARSFADLFGRKERLEYLWHVLGRDAGSRIFDLDDDARSASRKARNVSSPPSGIASIAFVARAITACCIWPPSAVTGGRSFSILRLSGPNVVAALLVRDKVRRGARSRQRSLSGARSPGTDAAEIEQLGRDRLAAKCFALDQAEILREVFGGFRRRKCSFVDPLFECLGTGGYRGERIIYLVHDAGRQTANRGKLLGTADSVNGLDPCKVTSSPTVMTCVTSPV